MDPVITTPSVLPEGDVEFPFADAVVIDLIAPLVERVELAAPVTKEIGDFIVD